MLPTDAEQRQQTTRKEDRAIQVQFGSLSFAIWHQPSDQVKLAFLSISMTACYRPVVKRPIIGGFLMSDTVYTGALRAYIRANSLCNIRTPHQPLKLRVLKGKMRWSRQCDCTAFDIVHHALDA